MIGGRALKLEQARQGPSSGATGGGRYQIVITKIPSTIVFFLEILRKATNPK